MTSKLRRTIVGVGIALGGAAPGCFGRTDVADLSSFEESDAPTTDASIEAAADAGPDASDAWIDTLADAATDATTDPFCDVSWPPTKATPDPGRVACVDPWGQCSNVEAPWRCYELIGPSTCDGTNDRVGPLYCSGGQWHCPPGADDGTGCRCWGPLPAGRTCTEGPRG